MERQPRSKRPPLNQLSSNDKPKRTKGTSITSLIAKQTPVQRDALKKKIPISQLFNHHDAFLKQSSQKKESPVIRTPVKQPAKTVTRNAARNYTLTPVKKSTAPNNTPKKTPITLAGRLPSRSFHEAYSHDPIVAVQRPESGASSSKSTSRSSTKSRPSSSSSATIKFSNLNPYAAASWRKRIEDSDLIRNESSPLEREKLIRSFKIYKKPQEIYTKTPVRKVDKSKPGISLLGLNSPARKLHLTPHLTAEQKELTILKFFQIAKVTFKKYFKTEFSKRFSSFTDVVLQKRPGKMKKDSLAMQAMRKGYTMLTSFKISNYNYITSLGREDSLPVAVEPKRLVETDTSVNIITRRNRFMHPFLQVKTKKIVAPVIPKESKTPTDIIIRVRKMSDFLYMAKTKKLATDETKISMLIQVATGFEVEVGDLIALDGIDMEHVYKGVKIPCYNRWKIFRNEKL